MQWLLNYIANLVPQLAGVTNMTGAITVAAIGLALWLISWHRKQRTAGNVGVEPSYIIAAGFVLVALGFIWQAVYPPASAKMLANLQSDFNRLVKPRVLSEEQMAAVEKFLLQRPKQKIKFVFEQYDSEANQYAVHLYRTFERAHWEVASLTTDKDIRLPEGLSFTVKYPRESNGDKNASDDITRAFKEANIPLQGSGSSRDSETGELYVIMNVGPRPKL